MKEIPLTQGKVAVVDDDDHEWLSSMKWCVSKKGPYANGRVNFYAMNGARASGEQYMHRLIAGALPGQEVDHVDGDGLNNRRQNLRVCSRRQNSMNMAPRKSVKGASKFKGVRRHSNGRCWQAMIKHNYKSIYVGTFQDETEAARAYDARARELFGEFARPNFP